MDTQVPKMTADTVLVVIRFPCVVFFFQDFICISEECHILILCHILKLPDPEGPSRGWPVPGLSKQLAWSRPSKYKAPFTATSNRLLHGAVTPRTPFSRPNHSRARNQKTRDSHQSPWSSPHRPAPSLHAMPRLAPLVEATGKPHATSPPSASCPARCFPVWPHVAQCVPSSWER